MSPLARSPRIQLNSRLLPALVILLFFLQLVAPYRGWMILLVGLGAAWLLAYLWARALARGLRVTREMRFGWAQVGDRLEERFTLYNDALFPALWVEVRDRSTLPDYLVSRATGVGAQSTNAWRTQGICTRRGIFTLGPTVLRSGDPFGIYTVSLDDAATATLVVMPPIVPLPSIGAGAGARGGAGRRRRDSLEQTVSSARVRDYQPGDSAHWIHWRTSAHHDALYVRQFDSTPAGDWLLVLDLEGRVQAGEGQNSTLEHTIILAASLTERGLRAGRAVGLVAHGDDAIWLPPQMGDAQRWTILRALTLASGGAHALRDVLSRANVGARQQTSLVVITPNVSSDWLASLLPLMRRGSVPTVLLLDPCSFGGAGDARAVSDALNNLAIKHDLITRDLLDRPEVRAGKQGKWEWRIGGTGRAVAVEQPRDLRWKALT